MFVALLLPPEAVEDLATFLEPRQQAGADLRWTAPEQWHVTLAFLPAVADRCLDDLVDRLARAAARRTPFVVGLAGAGAFPGPERAKVVYAGVDARADGQAGSDGDAGLDPGAELHRLATGARSAAVKAGTEVDGGRFHPHVTLARTGRPLEATRWLRVLDAYRGPTWRVEETSLVASYLGEGPRRRPRYEVVERFPLGQPST